MYFSYRLGHQHGTIHGTWWSPYDFLKAIDRGSIPVCITHDSWFLEPHWPGWSVMEKWWWELPSGIQNDYFAPSQHGAEHASCAGSIHMPCLQGCWLNCMLMDPQGLCSAMVLTQLGKHVLLPLSALWWPHRIVLNLLLVITSFRNILQRQPRLCFLSASDGYTTSTVSMPLKANLTQTSQYSIRLKNWTTCLSEYLFPLKLFGQTGPTYKISHIHVLRHGNMYLGSKQ